MRLENVSVTGKNKLWTLTFIKAFTKASLLLYNEHYSTSVAVDSSSCSLMAVLDGGKCRQKDTVY